MTSITDSSVIIQTSCESVPSTRLVAGGSGAHGLPSSQVWRSRCHLLSLVRFARRRFGHYEVIDFLAVQIALRDQWRTHPGGVLRAAPAFCAALYGLVRPRETTLPFGALTLSRPRLSLEATEALRALFLADLLARPVDNERHTGKLVDRVGKEHVVFDIDGTREAARQRARPQTEELPPPQRRLNQVCAAFLHGAQARGGCSYAHRRFAGS